MESNAQKTAFIDNNGNKGKGILKKRVFEHDYKWYRNDFTNSENYIIIPNHIVQPDSLLPPAKEVDVFGDSDYVTKGKVIKSYPNEDVAIIVIPDNKINTGSWNNVRGIQNLLSIGINGNIEITDSTGDIENMNVKVDSFDDKYIYLIPQDTTSFGGGMSGSMLKINGTSVGMVLSTDASKGKIIRLDFIETLVAPFFKYYKNDEFSETQLDRLIEWDIRSSVVMTGFDRFIILKEAFQKELFYLSRNIKTIHFGEKKNVSEIEIPITDIVNHYVNNLDTNIKIPFRQGSQHYFLWFTYKSNKVSHPIEIVGTGRGPGDGLIFKSITTDIGAPTIYIDKKYRCQLKTISKAQEVNIFFDDIEANNYTQIIDKAIDFLDIKLPKGIEKLTIEFILKDASVKSFDYKITDWNTYNLMLHKNKINDYIKRKPIIICQCAKNQESLAKANKKYTLKNLLKHFPVTYCYDIFSYKNNRFSGATLDYASWQAIKRIHLKGNSSFKDVIEINTLKTNENLSYKNLYKTINKSFRIFFKSLENNPKNLSMIVEFFDDSFSKEFPVEIINLNQP